MILLIDNYDSFTYNIFQVISKLGLECKVVRNDELSLDQLIELNPSHLVISPGPGRPEEAGVSLDAIKYFGTRIPVLGVCLGHQAMAQAFGGEVIRAPEPFHGKVSTIKHEQLGIFQSLKRELRVARYHSLIVKKENLPSCFIPTSLTEDGLIMSIKHENGLMEGVQFHPESFATEDGERMLKNFFLSRAA